MARYPITGGRVAAPVKVVLYGPEGIGKSTLAAAFPGTLFIDTEGGTKRLDVARLPRPESWEMLLDEVDGARRGEYGCGTLVIDTADWAERLCVRAVCERARVRGIEDFGYGKGYVYLKEEFEKLLNALEDVTFAGCNVVVTAHAQITKFEQPDEMGGYDRWTMKTSKQVAPLLREWCDALLFANYKTIVVKDGDGKSAKGKAQGGRRVLYTAHHPCWDAKNRFGLPDEVPMEFAAIAGIVADAGTQVTPTAQPAPAVAASIPAASAQAPAAPTVRTGPRSVDDLPVVSPAPVPTPALVNAPVQTAAVSAAAAAQTLAASQQSVTSAAHADLYARMSAAGIDDAELRLVVHEGGYYPEDMPVADYPDWFVSDRLLASWDGVVQAVMDRRDIPF